MKLKRRPPVCPHCLAPMQEIEKVEPPIASSFYCWTCRCFVATLEATVDFIRCEIVFRDDGTITTREGR